MLTIDANSPPSSPRKPRFYEVLYVQVIFAIIVGILLGHFFPEFGESLKPLGDAFIKLVKMIIALVLFLPVVTGIAGMNDMKSVGRVAGKAMLYFLTFSTLALVVGMVIANIIQPGAGLNIDPSTLQSTKVSEYVSKAQESSMIAFFMNIIPTTVLSPLTEGNILQVLFVSVLFGISLASVGERGKPITDLLQVAAAPMFKLVSIAMAFTIGKYGLHSISNLMLLIVTFYITSILFVLLILGAVARYNGFSIVGLIRYIKDELWLVLGTSSSEAALPNLMQKMEAAGCKKSVVGLVVPTGYSFNLDGTNIYMTMAALFIAQATNTDLTIGQQITLLLVAMLSSKGAAGVTGAGFITLAATLSVVPGLPVEGMALILGIDRFMSECRALTNFIGNACATIVVARWENALDKEQLGKAMRGELVVKTEMH